MTEILFYHLEQRPAEAVLPLLLEKTLERGWRAAVQVGDVAELDALDAALWTYRDDSFLPHGTGEGGQVADQPIVLVTDKSNANNAQIRFFVKGAVPIEVGDYERLVFMFDGHNPDAVTRARQAWKALKPDHQLTYWQQEPNGKWAKKA
ncbi:DNA polymerase III subunit chi [Maritalea sp.]|uniref:DNA polymerase III subunit chi n=1 Tax=Maritalea sp. TaxID=2003361 RepID=UPI0039E23968